MYLRQCEAPEASTFLVPAPKLLDGVFASEIDIFGGTCARCLRLEGQGGLRDQIGNWCVPGNNILSPRKFGVCNRKDSAVRPLFVKLREMSSGGGLTGPGGYTLTIKHFGGSGGA